MQSVLSAKLTSSAARLKNVSLAAVIAVSSVGAAVAPLFMSSAASAAASTQVVHESDVARQAENTLPTKNWVIYNRNVGTATFRSGPSTPPLGSGSLELTTPTAADKIFAFNYSHIGTKLSDINAISYSTYRSAGSLQQDAALNMEVDYNGPNVSGGFTTLVFEPVYNTGQGAVTDNTWQTWDAYSGGNGVWWSSKAIPGVCAFDCFVTWSGIVASNQDATILGGFGVNQGSGNPGLTTAVDKLVLGAAGDTVTYDFEPTLTYPQTKDDCKNNGWQTFTGQSFKNQGQCVSYVERHSHEVNGDITYTAGNLKRQAWFHMDTANNRGWFVYSDANHDWYGVRVTSVKVDGNTAWFAGQVDRSKDKHYNGNWLFAKVVDGKPDQIWGSFTTQAAAFAGVQAKSNPADGPFTVSRGNLRITRQD